MKKVINILSILLIVVLLAQLACTFLPCWNLTPLADRMNPDPKPTDYSVQEYCWTKCSVMNKIFEQQFKAQGYGKYNGNDYVIGLVLATVFSLLTILFTVVKLTKRDERIKTPGLTVLCNAFALAWVYFALLAPGSSYVGNYILFIGEPMVRTLLIAISAVGAVVVLARLVVTLISFIKEYRAEYCV